MSLCRATNANQNPWYSDETHAEYLQLLQLRRALSRELAEVLDKMAAAGTVPAELHDAVNLAAACMRQERIVAKRLEGEL